MISYRSGATEFQRKRSIEQRMMIVHGVLAVFILIIVARLLELQIIKGAEYSDAATSQHYGGVVLPARRGEILSRSSKTGETSILATNTTLDMVYVDPLITDDPTLVAETLAEILVTEEFHTACSAGSDACPRDLITFYAPAFDPMERVRQIQTGTLLEPLPRTMPTVSAADLPDRTEVQRLFARSIEERISDKRVRFVPLLYGATKVQLQAVEDAAATGIDVSWDQNLVYADPEQVDQTKISSIARSLSATLDMEAAALGRLLRSRPLRYVPIMHRLPPELSLKIREAKLASLKETHARQAAAPTRDDAQKIQDPLWSIALIAEHWRYYPDTTIASHVIGFLNNLGEAQYGIERTFNPQLRGQEGLISTVSDPQGRQILTDDQTIRDPKDGDSIILTIDRFVQKRVEEIMDKAVDDFDADSGQAIVMDPATGRIIAMVNAPLFDSNNYGGVYGKEPIMLTADERNKIVAELYHPDTNEFVIRAYINDLLTPEGLAALSEKTRLEIQEIEALHDLKDVIRYYRYTGENSRYEVFPTDRQDVWLRYANGIGVGAYINRNIQEIYEPGSVLKPVTVAIAIDGGEITPTDMYDDTGPVRVDEYTIKNALGIYYGKVTMTNCIEFSINTCMTTVSQKLGSKLFHRMLTRFGFGRITGIELEDELPGDMLPWRQWSQALLSTAAYGQGISATPLQVITAFSALANRGMLMKPTIIDSIIRSDGTVEKTRPVVVDQVVTPETADTVTAMLVSSVELGFAKVAKVKGHMIAGKTGTSQIAGPGGKYESGTGATIPTFAGYAPIDQPKFVILVKFDRARKDIYGSKTAGPVFKEIAAFLFDYYGIPPDDD